MVIRTLISVRDGLTTEQLLRNHHYHYVTTADQLGGTQGYLYVFAFTEDLLAVDNY